MFCLGQNLLVLFEKIRIINDRTLDVRDMTHHGGLGRVKIFLIQIPALLES